MPFDRDAQTAMKEARQILETALGTPPHDGAASTKTNILLSGMIRAMIALIPKE